MDQVSNFLLISRESPAVSLEQLGDLFLAPARAILDGKQVTFLSHDEMTIEDQQIGGLGLGDFLDETLRVIAFIISFPITVIGALLKLSVICDQSYWDLCDKVVGQLKWNEISEHLRSMPRFISDRRVTDVGRSLVFNPLGLEECACCHFHRLNSKRRKKLEDEIVSRLFNQIDDKEKPLQLLSMGSGGLMSDFIVLEKLLLAGFKKITIDCVDPIGIDEGRVERIRKFFSNLPGVTVEIRAYDSINKVPKRAYNAVMAIDYVPSGPATLEQDILRVTDLMKAYKCLDQSGFLALGDYSEDILCDTSVNAQLLFSSDTNDLYGFAQRLIEHLPKENEMKIVIPNLGFRPLEPYRFLFSLALAVKKSSREYEEISLSYLSGKPGDSSVGLFREMMQTFFGEATKIGLHENSDPDEKFDFLLTGGTEADFQNISYLSRLKPAGAAYIPSSSGRPICQKVGEESAELIQKRADPTGMEGACALQ